MPLEPATAAAAAAAAAADDDDDDDDIIELDVEATEGRAGNHEKDPSESPA